MAKKKTPKGDNVAVGFLGEVQDEMRQVTWPDRPTTFRLTAMVIVIVIIAGIYLGGLDYIFTTALSYLF